MCFINKPWFDLIWSKNTLSDKIIDSNGNLTDLVAHLSLYSSRKCYLSTMLIYLLALSILVTPSTMHFTGALLFSDRHPTMINPLKSSNWLSLGFFMFVLQNLRNSNQKTTSEAGGGFQTAPTLNPDTSEHPGSGHRDCEILQIPGCSEQ